VPTQAPASAEQIAHWLNDLDDAQYLVREAATQHLADAGAAALEPLLDAANGERPEPADRAMWILQRFSRSRDNDLALAALEKLTQLKNAPAVTAKAESQLAERSLAACEKRLTALGADVVLTIGQESVQTVVPMISVRLGQRWRGTADDLRQLIQLRQQRYFRLEGPGVDDDVVKMFVDKEKLALLHLFNTKATLAGVDAVKQKHPDAKLFLRNTAMLGVGGDTNAAGVLVHEVPQGSGAAAAGILTGDIITSLDGQKIVDFDRLTAHIAQHQPGDKVEVELLRGEQTKKVTVVLGKRPENEP
jgi:C-terminal processing protease CtpA/Prc